jgi:formyltetrahydrofolate-dependent phosphoribosylglycinamide formyltransferase
MTAKPPNRVRTAVLISGRGSNLAALIDAARAPGYPCEIVLVLSNQPSAAGLDLAARAGVPTLVIDHRPFDGDRQAHERALDAALRAAGIELIALAGYMRVFTPGFVDAWAGRMINIHPSLLPHFPGLDTHARAIAAGHATAGCTVHWVTADVDAGAMIARAEVEILACDTPESLAARVLTAEHELYPQALATAAKGLQA